MKINLTPTLLLLCLVGFISSFRNSEPLIPKAEKYYEKALEILQNTSENALSQAMAKEALLTIEKAIAIDPTVSKYYRVRGTCYFHLKNKEMSITNYLKAIELDSSNELALMNLAITYENMDSFKWAESYYSKALDYTETPAGIYFNIGLLYHKWGKDTMAIEAFNRVIKLAPGFGDAYSNRGTIYLALKSYEEAIADFDLVIKYNPENKIAYNNRGLCQFYLKRYELAILDYKKAISIKMDKSFKENYSTDAYSYNNLGNCYKALGDDDEACKYWKQAIEKGYVYQKKWKEEYNIDDPKELILKYCK